MAPSGRKFYYLPFGAQAVRSETFAYNSMFVIARLEETVAYIKNINATQNEIV
jgi:hypothetical protein